MNRKLLLIVIVLVTFGMTACENTSITCGEGTIIQDGQCVAPDAKDDNQDPQNNTSEASCDDLTGNVFYEADFSTLANKLVDNEDSNPHTVRRGKVIQGF